MRIGVDATCWPVRRGYGRFTRALLTAALAIDRKNEYVFFVDSDSQEFPLPEASAEIRRVASSVPASRAAAADGRRALRDVWALSRAISQESFDLFFFPSVYSYVPMINAAPKIVTVHDIISDLYPELVFPTLRSKLFWRAKVKLACAQARMILTVSEYSRRCLADYMKIPPSRLRSVNEASDPVFQRLKPADGRALLARLGLSPGVRFLTYVGGFSPHKNLRLLVDAFSQLQSNANFSDVRLLLVGDYEHDVFYSCYSEIVEQVRKAGLQQRVVFTGYLSDEDLVVLLNLTQALALPSFCEGFGLPAVEAAACGAPTVVTTESPLPDLLGGGTIGVAPNDREGLLRALETILDDPARQQAMSTAALAAAARLSWEHSARQLIGVFEEVCETRGTTA